MGAHLFDLHDEAFYIWRELGVRDAVLVHVDGHHDIEAAVPSGLVAIGNYVRAAFEQGIVSRVHWVVPDPLWHGAMGRAAVDYTLKETQPVPVTAGGLAELPAFVMPVLLDVDVDYCFTIGYGRDPLAVRLSDPWCPVEDIAAVLRGRCPRRIVTTIATSVTGGFTPFEWRHLGGELASALEGTAVVMSPEPRFHPFRTPGHVLRKLERWDEAEASFTAAVADDPSDPWPALGLAMVAASRGHMETALRLLPDTPEMEDSLDWWRTFGAASAGLGDLDSAIAAYMKSLALATRGAVPLDMRTCNRDRRLVDPAHWDDHAALAALYERRGDAALARAHRAMAETALGGPSRKC